MLTNWSISDEVLIDDVDVDALVVEQIAKRMFARIEALVIDTCLGSGVTPDALAQRSFLVSSIDKPLEWFLVTPGSLCAIRTDGT